MESIVVPENVILPVLAEPVAVIVMLPSASLVVSIPVPPINFILSPVPICLRVLSSAPIARLNGSPAPPCIVTVSYTHLTLPTTPYV